MIRQFSDLPASNDVVAYCVSEETPPMTMQVGMVGADGILLASDTKVFQEPLLSTGVRTEHGMSKFRVGRSVAVAVAHDMDQGMSR